jgi:hypothetical protein
MAHPFFQFRMVFDLSFIQPKYPGICLPSPNEAIVTPHGQKQKALGGSGIAPAE